MPSRLNAPALTVDVRLKYDFDTCNVENLFRLWTGERPSWKWVRKQGLTCLQSHDPRRQ